MLAVLALVIVGQKGAHAALRLGALLQSEVIVHLAHHRNRVFQEFQEVHVEALFRVDLAAGAEGV